MQKSLSEYQELITNYMYLGVLPFFIGAFGPWIFADHESVLTHYFIIYSTIIFAFLSGAIWAIALFSPINFPRRHMHVAIVLSLIPFFSFFTPAVVNVSLLFSAYFILLFWEKLFINALYPSWYQAMRHRISFIVIACHMLVIWNLIRS